MKTLKTFSIIIFLGTSITLTANAADNCNNFDSEPAYFKELYNDSKQLGRAICDSLGRTIDQDFLVGQYVEFANKIEKVVEDNFDVNSDYYKELKVQIAQFKALSKLGLNKANLPYFKVNRHSFNFDDTNLYFHFEIKDWDVVGDADTASTECNQTPSCEELLKSLAIAINQYKEPYVRLSAEATTKNITILRKSWDNYFEEARSQTMWDAVLTTSLEKRYLTQDKLVGPMQRQWFLVHPSLVVENASNALDGEEAQQGLAVEWFGVNWWNKETSPIGTPFGISLASIYSSRPSVDDVGHGIMLTFSNSLSIGWADHGGDDGYYISVDFLSLLTEKKERWKDYKKNIRELEFK